MKFKEVLEILNNIPCINSGGCGISLLSTYKWLKKNKRKMPMKFFYLYEEWNKDVFDNNQNVLKTGQGLLKAPNHCCLKYGNKFYDSDGIINVNRYDYISEIENEELLKNTINNVDSWNHVFNRSNINIIENKLNISLAEIRR